MLWFSFYIPAYGLLTGEDRVQLQGVELGLIHAASLEEVRSQSPAKQKCMSAARHLPRVNRFSDTPEEHIGERVVSLVLQPHLFHADGDVTVFSSVTQQLQVSRDEQKICLVFERIFCTCTHAQTHTNTSRFSNWASRSIPQGWKGTGVEHMLPHHTSMTCFGGGVLKSDT